ncbi:Ribosome biogenesis protein Kri1, partial [Tieghemiomyces parasiticus]
SSSVRRKDNRRKLARQRVAQRKLEEKQAKLKELARLRAEKKREIWDRLQTIREITGNKTAGFDDLDLDGEFDPEKHEAMMGKLLENDEDQFGEGGEGPGEKPVWDDEDYGDYGDLEEDGSASRSTKKLPVGDDDFIMDADYLPGGDNYDGSEAPAPPNKKPKKMASDAMDDVYDLGYEDIIDGMPTRFKYQKVEKEDFGLSAVDILLANEDELNAYVDQNAFSPYLNPDVPSHRFTPREEDRARLQNRLNQKISTLPENAEEAESMPITLFASEVIGAAVVVAVDLAALVSEAAGAGVGDVVWHTAKLNIKAATMIGLRPNPFNLSP